ncbi:MULTISPECIES: hypothetical protein [Ralstonia solanacearum species complex]|uniref:hypothetical protein n=1 Tax=Ralstonia solanacearum species complex TaxID=3116862 RepID=UPI001F08D985|nr:hypothetical protein [Ralstonia solanacearum]
MISRGDLLDMAMKRAVAKNDFDDKIKKLYGDKAEDIIESLPNFDLDYQSWYTEALAFVKQIIPDRVQDFVRHYEKAKGRKDVTYENYVIEDFLHGLRITRGGGAHIVVDRSAALRRFEQQIAIVRAGKARFDSSLFDIKNIVQADLLDSEMAAAGELLKHKFVRAAGAVAGVVLERHLRTVCQHHNVLPAKKNSTIFDFNEALKSNNVIDVPAWRNVQFLADIRNLCDHSKVPEPTAEQVGDLIEGVKKVIKTMF